MKTIVKMNGKEAEIDTSFLLAEIDKTIKHELRSCVTTCLNCQNFSEGTEQCELNLLRPPARIIAFGCECWTEEIPF